MNYYERIQKAINYFEENLSGNIDIKQAASQACFSLSHFYRIFHALVGHTAKEYIRKRRFNEAADRLVNTDDRIIDICLDYQFEYQESFTRSFKDMFGVSPGVFRKRKSLEAVFPALDLLDIYFRNEEDNWIDPRIKVLKKLEPMRVAYYRAFSSAPEREALAVLTDWVAGEGLSANGKPYRIFGFDNPGPSIERSEYGYEAWITISPDVKESGDIKIKEFEGGLYAVTGTTVSEITKAWKNFLVWLELSKYSQGTHQCLEELVWPVRSKDENLQLDLYLPISE